MDYDFRKIEKKWQTYWAERGTFKTKEDPSKPVIFITGNCGFGGIVLG